LYISLLPSVWSYDESELTTQAVCLTGE